MWLGDVLQLVAVASVWQQVVEERHVVGEVAADVLAVANAPVAQLVADYLAAARARDIRGLRPRDEGGHVMRDGDAELGVLKICSR